MTKKKKKPTQTPPKRRLREGKELAETHSQHVAGPGREARQRSLQIHSVLPSLSGGADARSERTTILSQTRRTLGREEGGLGSIHRHRVCHLPFVWGVLAIASNRRPRDFPTTKSAKEARNCILVYTFPWRTKAILTKAGMLGDIFVSLLVFW